MSGDNVTRNPCTHTGHASTCPECRDVEPVIEITSRNMQRLKDFMPEQYEKEVRLQKAGRLVVLNAARGL